MRRFESCHSKREVSILREFALCVLDYLNKIFYSMAIVWAFLLDWGCSSIVYPNARCCVGSLISSKIVDLEKYGFKGGLKKSALIQAI